VVGAGLGVGLLGSAFEWRAGVNNRAFGTHFTGHCPPPKGCFESQYNGPMNQHEQRYLWYRRIGHGLSITGAATAISGLVLVSLNRPEHIENPARRNLIRVTVAPGDIPDAVSVSVKANF
jgi:hypothetical protein